jgi:hypothetical protein
MNLDSIEASFDRIEGSLSIVPNKSIDIRLAQDLEVGRRVT